MGDEMQRIVEALALPPGRPVGSDGHDAARAFLLEAMHGAGLRPMHGDSFELPYTCGGEHFCNLMGVLAGVEPELPPVLLGAHYDTCGEQPGADDNAAAIAILLDSVEPLRAASLRRSLVFAFFDAEEPPHFLQPSMGSTWFYEQQREEDFHCALVLDLVGHDVPIGGLEDALFVTGVESDPGLEAVFRGAAEAASGLRTITTLTRYIGDMSDYHAFRRDRRPFLFLSCGQWEHYHAPSDTPEKLNYGKMEAIGGMLRGLVAGVDGALLDGPFEGYDTTALELEYLSRHAGELAASLGMPLESRDDIESVAGAIVSGLLGG